MEMIAIFEKKMTWKRRHSSINLDEIQPEFIHLKKNNNV